jgi:hypothetical protein
VWERPSSTANSPNGPTMAPAGRRLKDLDP